MNVYPTPRDLTNWISSSHKGDRFIYHTGNLMHDRKFRAYMAATGGFTVIEVKPLTEIAEAAMEAYQNGFVVLAQRRLGDDMFEYLAIRTKKYAKPPLAKEK